MALQKRKVHKAKGATSVKQSASGLLDLHYDNRFFIGLLLLTIGALVLAVNLGAMDASVLAYWPIIVIVWGLLLIL